LYTIGLMDTIRFYRLKGQNRLVFNVF